MASRTAVQYGTTVRPPQDEQVIATLPSAGGGAGWLKSADLPATSTVT
jgi:hypothetical protein